MLDLQEQALEDYEMLGDLQSVLFPFDKSKEEVSVVEPSRLVRKGGQPGTTSAGTIDAKRPFLQGDAMQLRQPAASEPHTHANDVHSSEALFTGVLAVRPVLVVHTTVHVLAA